MQAPRAFGFARACFELLGYLLAIALAALGFIVGEFETLSANVTDRRS